jgi:uncharacterized circularly permuted ATP-grasp superfamily protein/uncharacterized alpha-E superfamily protein
MTMSGLAPPEQHQASDLFGPDPGTDPLAYYAAPDPAADIFRSSDPDIAAKWRAFATGLSNQSQSNLASFQSYLDRHVEDLGLAFRMTGDEQERAWPLNPMPVLIGAQEWFDIERGLVQRAELLERVVADIYGPQTLVRDGHLPAALVSGSSRFARRMVGLQPPGGHFLHIYAVDLARGPTGEWRVLADRVRLPIGIGYALENRLALSRATGGLLASIGAQRQSGFFEALRQGIASNCVRADPRIGLLTPGRFNQSYPEQAHLARHLGFSLVEGRDLVVREGKLFVRTIAGLKRIDALWRWIGTRDIDPLNFDSRSQIGVPNLVSAAMQGLVLANWPGAGVLESRAIPAFLPKLADTMLGEPLRLPNAATWWCGGAEERAHVLDNLDSLVISSAFHRPVTGLPDGHTRAGSTLTASERAEIERGMARRPMDYSAQEIVSLSTTPTLADGHFEPRGFTLRAFLARDGNGNWVALQGGFARVSQRGDLRNSLMGLGDISTDVCIVNPTTPEIPASPPKLEAPAVRREQGLIPSQAADNLFWIGRYGERAHQTVRIIRTLIEQVGYAGGQSGKSTTVSRLCDLLRDLYAVPKDSKKWTPARIAGTALSDNEQIGSVRALAINGRQIALLLRDRLTRDSWRAIQRSMPSYIPCDLESMAGACDRLVERFAALARLLSDGMSRGPAYNFLDMGICLERGSMILQQVGAMVPGSASAEDLSALLDIVDGQSLYRTRYLTMPFIAPVCDILLLDPAQPHGLAYQLARIEEHLSDMPVVREDGMVEEPLRLARQMRARLEGLDADQIVPEVLASLQIDLAAISDAIGERYFLQVEEPVTNKSAGLLT